MSSAMAGEGTGTPVDRPCLSAMLVRWLVGHYQVGAPENALLAQSAEHSHGKAGVVGSIPTEGSTMRPGTTPRA